jgi:thiamine pyrophosphate-dependent acetolactate synthase large subunit-like protein
VNTAADVSIQTSYDWRVDVIYGLPGDGIDGISEALRIRVVFGHPCVKGVLYDNATRGKRSL